jgi:hypothetical protein
VNDQAIVRALQGWQAQAHPEGEPNPERYQRDMEAYRGNTMMRVGDPAEPAPARYDRIAFPRFPGKEGEYLERLLGDLEADGVEVLLVGLPDFIATYRTDFEQQAFNDTFESLAASHRHCVFLNYDTPDRFPLSNAAYFIDGKYGSPNSHLSRAGIKPFLHVFLPDLRKALARSADRHD